MAEIIDFDSRRRRRAQSRDRNTRAKAEAWVECTYCGERHPMVREPGEKRRCVTAFFDGQHWFCRNSGCRRAWLEAD